ncbi:MAG: Hsp33 family molecular chaperone HslO, partial [Oscillospiraceae bacterium]
MSTLIRAITDDGTVLATAIDSTDMVGRAEQIHSSSATVTAAIGRLLTAASMMGSMLKNEDDMLTLRLAG